VSIGKWSVVSFSRLLKSFAIFAFVLFVVFACSNRQGTLKISDDRSYEASLFRQNCAICHGFEGEGKDIGGKMSANLRLSQKTEEEMFEQIANGGNGMLPFRYQLQEKDIRSLAKYIKQGLHPNQ
jgi:mono/diheme cytochrome c family protein